MRPLWFVSLLKAGFPGRFLLARLTRLPVLGKIMDHHFFRGDRMILMPRESVISVDEKLPLPGSMVLPAGLVEHFVSNAKSLWIMNACICRQAAGCRDYPVDLGCLFMGEAVHGINPELGRPATREHALEHVRKCSGAGLVHLAGRNRLDPFWLGVKPAYRLFTVCSCCPCCCLWKMLPDLSGKIESRITGVPGVSLEVTDACNGCGDCTGVCFVNAIRVESGRAVISAACRACGRCAEACSRKAIRVRIEPGAFDRARDILSPLVDLR